MKVQFAAISEQKAEVERKLEPLAEEEAKLKHEIDEFESRRSRHAVDSFLRSTLLSDTYSLTGPDRASRREACKGNQ